MSWEKTFAMIKPDAVLANATGSIIRHIEDAHFHIAAMVMIQLTTQQIGEFYGEHAAKQFYNPLVDFMASSKLIAMVLKHPSAVAKWRSLIGATNPDNAEPNTLRELYGTKMPRNAVHGSDSVESAYREIRLFQSFLHPLWAEVTVP